MSHLMPFQIKNFENYCKALERVGVDPGFIMYTNHHVSNHQPAARLVTSSQLPAAQAYIAAPSDETFKRVVEIGVLLDTEWDRQTERWMIISFEGWEVLHTAFSRLYAKSGYSLTELTGVSEADFS